MPLQDAMLLSFIPDIILYMGRMIMPRYTFKVSDLEYRTVDALDLDDALERAGIGKDSSYELEETDDFSNKCLISAITDEILFGS